MKKKYIKPTIIDLSIEGMTGFGYGVLSSYCDDGNYFTPGSCNPMGNSANSPCIEGGNPTNECNAGNLPVDGGSFCGDGSAANGRYCSNGTTVLGYNPNCMYGGSGINILNTPPDCDDGITANYCIAGNSNVGPFS